LSALQTADKLGHRHRVPRGNLAKIDRRHPKYVKDCHFGNWTVNSWKKDKGTFPDGAYYRLSRYRCRSWRHPGACRNDRSAIDVDRIRGAIASTDPRAYTYLVLTFDQRRRVAAGGDLFGAYKALLSCWSKLRKRLIREWGPMQYVAVVEQHRSGWPHLNVLIYSPSLAADCRHTATVTRRGKVYDVQGWQRIRSRWLRHHAVESGFGPITYLEPMKDGRAMSAYLVKLAGQLTGEMAKGSQVPVLAPRHFRRLRASVGFLPPLPKDETITGRLTLAPVEQVAGWGAPFNPIEISTPIEIEGRTILYIETDWDIVPWDVGEVYNPPMLPEERAAMRRQRKAWSPGLWS
jgi:hypothetical protein